MNCEASLGNVLEKIKQAISLLESAEHEWPKMFDAAALGDISPEAARIEELLHVATHETGNTLAFMVQDIEALLARLKLRQRYSVFSPAQFNRIIKNGWDTASIYQLHKEFPSMPLVELSRMVKLLCSEWNNLSPVRYKSVP